MSKKQKQPDNKIKPLTEREGKYFQEVIDANNRYQGILKQKAQYEYAIKQMEADRTKVQKGEIKPPFILTVIPKVLSREVTDKKEIIDLFDKQLQSYKKMLKSLVGQVEHRYDEYQETAARHREYINKRFAKAKVRDIAPDRRTGNEEEETLFEAEFEKLADDPDLQKELKEAQKEAVKRNVARKTKSKK